jgi:hypothetical protein
MKLQNAIIKEKNLVAILKVTDEKKRIRSRIRSRIRQSEVRIRGSGSVPRCYGSVILFQTDQTKS